MIDLEKIEGNVDRLVDILAKVERMTAMIPELFVQFGVANLGYQATGELGGALAGLVGLKLAQSSNLPAGVAGVATLAGLGVASLAKETEFVGPMDPSPESPITLADAYAMWGSGGL